MKPPLKIFFISETMFFINRINIYIYIHTYIFFIFFVLLYFLLQSAIAEQYLSICIYTFNSLAENILMFILVMTAKKVNIQF